MSGIVAIYHRDGRPVNPRRLDTMVQAMAHRGPDGITQWIQGPVGLGHCLMHTTPESLQERQPVCDGQCWLIWDGRLDNRDDVLTALKAEGLPCGSETDPELVLGAYRLWGGRCVEKLLGEFAFVVWDRQTGTLFGARDRIGLKPFYYMTQGQTVLIASEVKPILKVLDRMPEPDDEMILALLIAECREPDNHRSLFSGIHRLPPGHLMLIKDGQLKIERYWQIDPRRQTIYRRPEDYVEQFRTLFQQTVKSRTRSAFPVACFVSGGIDSSSFTALAASQGARVEAFNDFAADEPGADERPFARQVCETFGIPLWELQNRPCDPLEGLEDLLWKVESPVVGPFRDTQGFAGLVNARNCRVVLHGEGADQLLDEFGYLGDVLLRRSPVQFVRETIEFTRWLGSTRGLLGTTPRVVLRHVMPNQLKYLGKRLLRQAPPPWINQNLARSVNLTSRIRVPRVPIRFPSLAQTFAYQEGLGPYFVLKLELIERYTSWQGWEIRYPYLDSRLVEFIFSIPWQQRCHGGVRQWLLRQAMQGILPEAVRLRKDKGDWTKPMDRDLRPLCLTQPPEPLANRSGILHRYLDLDGTRKLVERYLRGTRKVRWDVWGCITLDRWLLRFWKGGEADVRERAISQETLQPAEAALVR